nr:hypothetical protein B0A51_03234 [Rachicladosporium sp. CCFEE 5018]
MYATLSYINTKHPYGDFPSQPSQAPPSHSAAHASSDHPLPNGSPAPKTNGTAVIDRDGDDKKETNGGHIPDGPEVFQETMRRLAQSLVLQEQKAEILINSLPGLGNSEAMQSERMRELEGELREVEEERRAAEGERERLVEMLGEVVVGSRRKRYARPPINAFDESFAAALHPAKQPSDILNTPDAVLVQQAVKSGASNPARPRTVSLVGSKVLPQSKAAPSLAICVWNEVSHTSEYTRPAVDLLKEVLEVRYPALGSPGSGERYFESNRIG